MKKRILALTLMLVAVPLLAWGVIRVSFIAHLTGSEVAPPIKTEATGGTVFTFRQDSKFDVGQEGNSLHFTISVQNLRNVTTAHIHLGAVGKEGPPVVALYPFGPSPQVKEGKFSGKLAEGIITAANLEGPLKGKPLSDLIKEIQVGNAYVKVHTKQNPDGELRGRISRRPN